MEILNLLGFVLALLVGMVVGTFFGAFVGRRTGRVIGIQHLPFGTWRVLARNDKRYGDKYFYVVARWNCTYHDLRCFATKDLRILDVGEKLRKSRDPKTGECKLETCCSDEGEYAHVPTSLIKDYDV